MLRPQVKTHWPCKRISQKPILVRLTTGAFRQTTTQVTLSCYSRTCWSGWLENKCWIICLAPGCFLAFCSSERSLLAQTWSRMLCCNWKGLGSPTAANFQTKLCMHSIQCHLVTWAGCTIMSDQPASSSNCKCLNMHCWSTGHHQTFAHNKHQNPWLPCIRMDVCLDALTLWSAPARPAGVKPGWCWARGRCQLRQWSRSRLGGWHSSWARCSSLCAALVQPVIQQAFISTTVGSR